MRGAGAGDARRSGERRWTVLFIGDHGTVIPFKRVKTVAILVAAAMTTAVAAVAVLAWVNQGLHARARDQLQRLESSRAENEQLRRERDLLTAQVVVLESRMRETASESGAPAERRPVAPPSLPVAPPAEPEAPRAAAQIPEHRPPIDLGEGVAVDGFRLNPKADGSIELRYKLTALAQPRTPLAGHVIVVLSAEDVEPERWLSLPRVELVRGRPTGRQKGYTFAISHNKEFVQSAATPRPLPAFTRAVLYVFGSDGRLLLARDYSVRF